MNFRLEQIAMRTAEGRRWMALWIVDRLRPRPANMSMEVLDAWVGDADLDAMRAKVERERQKIMARFR